MDISVAESKPHYERNRPIIWSKCGKKLGIKGGDGLLKYDLSAGDFVGCIIICFRATICNLSGYSDCCNWIWERRFECGANIVDGRFYIKHNRYSRACPGNAQAE